MLSNFYVANTHVAICQFHGYDPRVSDFVSFLAAAVGFSAGFHNIGGTGIISTGGEGGVEVVPRGQTLQVSTKVSTLHPKIFWSASIRVLSKFKGLL